MSVIGTIRDATTGATAGVAARSQTPTGNVLQVQIGPGDVVSNLPVIIDYEHHQIHEGETHKAIDTQASLGTATVKYGLTIATYAVTIQSPHIVIEADTYNGSCRIDIYESATFTGGTLMTWYNRNRNSATAPATTVRTGVTSTNGTLIDSFFAGAGKSTAGQGRQGSEWVMKSNTIYRIDLVGLVANTQCILSFNAYEDLGV